MKDFIEDSEDHKIIPACKHTIGRADHMRMRRLNKHQFHDSSLDELEELVQEYNYKGR